AKELTLAAEDVVIDYLALGPTGTGSEQRALVLILPRDLKLAYMKLCRTAGLRLTALVPRFLGGANCLKVVAGTTVVTPAPASPQDAVAVLTVTAGWAEFGVFRGSEVLFTRSLAPGVGLIGEVKRNLALYAGLPRDHPSRDAITALYIAGDNEHAALRGPL